jgi:hypothetical protein
MVKLKLLPQHEIRYISNGRIVEKIPGQIAQVPVDERETYLDRILTKVTM